LPKDILDKELELFGLLGVKFAFSTKLGRDVRLEDLRSSSDAVILALGSYHHASLELPGSDGTGVVQGTDVLKRLAVHEPDTIGKRVVIIGGGNVAIDVARSLWRLDKDVVIAYRREADEMPANRSEIEEAQAEGLTFLFNVAPTEVIRDAQQNVIALRCEHLLPGVYDLSGRRKRGGTSTFEDLACDTIVIAVGERVDGDLLASEGLSVTKGGQLAAQRHSYLTSKANVWAIGDVITGPSTAAEAMGHGKEVASIIDRCLMGKERFASLFSSFTYDKSVAKTLHEGKAIQAEKLELSQRKHSFAEVNKGYSGRQARMEAGRCLRCDIHLEEVLNGQQPSAHNN
ncbi:MAG: FAD-dependent oxidoreductase, partial [Sphaerochaeta sp.]|nr:FAD-dependent oxidoreductase [Sphaerochaeta sp.]